MKKIGALMAVVLLLALLCACDLANLGLKELNDATGASVQLTSVDVGWVEVNVSGAVGGFRIHWGDSYDRESYSDVGGPGVYTHWFPRPGRYAVALLNGETVVATVAVPVPKVQHHLEFLSQNGRELTVRYYGQKDTYYYIHWGAVDIHTTPGPQMANSFPDGVTVVGNGSPLGSELVHYYYVGNTYDVTMCLLGDLPSNARKFFSVVVP